jgi:predicted lipoprotein with Yx(FWY)xxD motif
VRMTRPTASVMTMVKAGAAIAAGALLLAACSSGKSYGGGGAANTTNNTNKASATAVVETHKGALGTYLTDAAGKTLYMFASDSSSMSTCTGQCATFWPPVTTTGTPTASAGATGSMLATITRSDGTHQVTYGGHPLYTFAEDTAAGDTKGQGSTNFGAKWWVLTPAGQPITGASSGSSAPTSSYNGY